MSLGRLNSDFFSHRVQLKPYVELKDSDGRPDEEVAHEVSEQLIFFPYTINNPFLMLKLYGPSMPLSAIKVKTIWYKEEASNL